MTKRDKKKLIIIIISIVLLAVSYAVNRFLEPRPLISVLIFLVPYAVSGYEVVIKCSKDIAGGEIFGENLLMTVATVGAFAIGKYPEAVFVMVFYDIGSLFESIAVGKSRKSISHLTDMMPEYAEVIKDGKAITVPIEEINVGDTVFVKAGSRFPVDCTVISGSAGIDTSALTGESLPFDAAEGDNILSGSIALDGAIYARALKSADNSAVAKIIEMIENATSSKAKSEKFITAFSRIYTPCVVAAAVLIAIVPSLITGSFAEWLHRALIFLVVSCPCALVISIPLSYFGGIGACAKCGVLVKGSNSLEALSKVKNFVFDKTGTLTKAKLKLDGVFPAGISEKELLSYAAACEASSDHPLAKALTAHFEATYGPCSLHASDVKEMSGMGMSADVDGRTVHLGNEKLMSSIGAGIEEMPDGAAVCIAIDGKYRGCVTFSDTVKETSEEAIKMLKTCGAEVYMLSGDRKSAVRALADQLGIDKWFSEMLPDEKAKKIALISKEGGKVAFTGDGINDAPCLAAADVGFAMGEVGSNLAIECADIVLTDDDPMKIYSSFAISKKVKRIVIENIVFALSVKALVLILAAFGVALMWEAVIADVGVSVIAILNSLRLLKS